MHETENAQHAAAWLEYAAKDAPAEALPGLFEAAWSALWRRSENAVGAIVLESIARLIHADVAARYPFLSTLDLGSAEVDCNPILESAGALEKSRLREALAFTLAEFITAIGDLTDQILTPGLYAELSRLSPGFAAAPAVQEKSRPESLATTQKQEMTMTAKEPLSTGSRNLDEILGGGLIKGSSTAIAGPSGSGKTILAQEIAFHVAAPDSPVIFFSTLSEPGAKALFYLKKFAYFDQKKIDECLHFVDLGILLRTKGLRKTLEVVIERVEKLKPTFVVMDSFKVFEDMAESKEDLRKFSYELVIDLITRKCTALFLGEYAPSDVQGNPLFSIIDGLITMSQRVVSGEPQRYIQVVKMRGTAHSRSEHAFQITPDGVAIFAPRLTIQRGVPTAPGRDWPARCRTGMAKFDDLLGVGIPRGSSLLIAGAAGTGKTVLGLEFIYRGALAGEKGIIFSFEETGARLRAEARGLGFDMDGQIDNGMVKIIFIPQPEVQVERHLLMMEDEIRSLNAARVVIDSLSVFVHKVEDPQVVREKVFQLASIIQNAEAVGFFVTDIPYGSYQMSRFGVEETVVDGVVILTATEEGLERERYIEVYKLRNTAHLKGRHTMTIGKGGIKIFPRYQTMEKVAVPPPPAKIARRLSCGIAELDKLLGSGLLDRSMTLISGSSGIGKTMVGIQFLLEGAAKGEPGLFVTLEEAPEELLANAAALGLPLKKAVDAGFVDILYLPPTHIRSTQLLAVLTDKINSQKARRLVLDSTTHIVASGMSRDDVRELVYDLAVRFKDLGVTSLFTLESDLMYSTDSSTDTYRGFAPLADNVIVMRYVPSLNRVISTLMVVKTRGSAHDHGLFDFVIGKGGMRLGSSLTIAGGTRDVSGPTGDQQAQAAEMGRKH